MQNQEPEEKLQHSPSVQIVVGGKMSKATAEEQRLEKNIHEEAMLDEALEQHRQRLLAKAVAKELRSKPELIGVDTTNALYKSIQKYGYTWINSRGIINFTTGS